MTINLVNATLGSGILSLPWAMAGASIVVGVCLTVLVLVLNGLTNMILVVAAERTQAFDLGNLMGKLPGRWSRPVRSFVDVSIWLSVGLGLIGYFIVVADASLPVLPILGIPSWCGRTFSISIAALVVLPLTFMDLNRLAISSSISVAANVYLLGLVAYLFLQNRDRQAEAPSCLMGTGPGSITMCSALMQAIIFQMCTLPMYETLEDRSPGRFAACLTVSFCFVSIVFVVLSCMAVTMFGLNASSNILQDLPNDLAGNVARFTMGIAVLGVYPIYLQSMVAPLRHTEERAARRHQVLTLPSPAHSPSSGYDSPWSNPSSMGELQDSSRSSAVIRGFGQLRVKLLGLKMNTPAKPSELATLLIIVTTAMGGWGIGDLGVCNIVGGASQVSCFVGWAPGLAGIFLMGWHGRMWQALMAFLILFATVMSGIGFVYRDNFVETLHCFQTVA